MKKTTAIILFLGIGGLFMCTFVTARLTHYFDYYFFATESNLPGHAKGELFFATSPKLKKPEYGNFVCFKSQLYHEVWIQRVVGKANDVIEIKDALVYRNGVKLNEPFTWNEYTLSPSEYKRVAGFIQAKNNQVNQMDSSYIVAFTDAEIKQYKLNVPKFTTPKGVADSQFFADFKSKNFNADNFGPVRVPANCYFLLGDNRHYSMDSRYIGFVKADDIQSVMLGN